MTKSDSPIRNRSGSGLFTRIRTGNLVARWTQAKTALHLREVSAHDPFPAELPQKLNFRRYRRTLIWLGHDIDIRASTRGDVFELRLRKLPMTHQLRTSIRVKTRWPV